MTSFVNFCVSSILDKPFTIDEIKIKRDSIEQEIQKMVKTHITIDNFDSLLTERVINKIIELYDSKFFFNKLADTFGEKDCSLRVCFDNRCTKTAGVCKLSSCRRITIQLATKVFKKALKTGSAKINAGLECAKFLTCLLITFEHELIHALQFCLCHNIKDAKIIKDNPSIKDKIFVGPSHEKSGHGKIFMTIVKNKFGHMEYTHALFKHKPKYFTSISNHKGKDRLSIKEIKETIKPGDKIMIMNLEGVEEVTFVKFLKTNFIYFDGKSNWKFNIKFILDKISPKKPSPKKPSPKRPSPKKPSPKKPSPKKKLIKKSIKNVWDGPHQDKFIPGVAKEYKGKRIDSLDEAKRISSELGEKSTGFTKKKFYSIRNGKTLRKATGEISWIKK